MAKDQILIFRNQGIGDLMLISPAIRAIRALHPDAHICLFVGKWSRVAVENNPDINEITSYPDDWVQKKNPFRILQLIFRLRRRKFKRVYIFHSHNLLHLMVYLAGIPERYGFTFKGTGRFLTHKTEWQPNTSRYIADNYLDIPGLAGAVDIDLKIDLFLSPQAELQAQTILQKYNLSPQKYITIAPGGGINPRQNVFEKRWGERKFSQLIELIADKIRAPIILLGAPAEKSLCHNIFHLTQGKVINLGGEFPFDVSSALVKKSGLLITNDSAIMHTAVAFKIPSLAVFGPSNPLSLLPPSKINLWISSGLDCSPCYCNSIFPGCDKDLACMKELSPSKVFNLVEELWFEHSA